MPYKEKKIERLYYSIGEVADMFQVNTSLIRFWEKEFDILKPKKNKKGNRLFTPEDIENLKLIFYLSREKGLTLAGVKKRLRENKDETFSNFRIIEKLKAIKAALLRIRDEM